MTHSMATHQSLHCLRPATLILNNESFQYDENIRMEEFLTHNLVVNI